VTRISDLKKTESNFNRDEGDERDGKDIILHSRFQKRPFLWFFAAELSLSSSLTITLVIGL
jgi:hypothetical protein